MKSRMEKYYTEAKNYNRTTRNAELYKEVYGNYTGLENLPIADNTNEIDIKDLREIVNSSEKRKIKHTEPIDEEELSYMRKQEEHREYDINKILEKAKSTNKPKEDTRKNTSLNYKFLTTLESQELPVTEIKKAYQEAEYTPKIKEEQKNESKEEQSEIYMTRELKFHEKQLEITKEIELLKEEESSPLDLFEDLKPTENSFIVEAVKPEKNSIFAEEDPIEEISDPKIEEIKSDNKQSDIINDEDIDIIKKESWKVKSQIDDDFYTNSYKFSKRDFIDEEEDFCDNPKKGSGILKTFLLLLAIFALTTIIYFFISKYGIGI